MRKTAALVWLVLTLFAGTYLSVRIGAGLTFRSDLMALIPREDQNETLMRTNDSVTRALSQKIVLLIGHADRERSRDAANEIMQAMTNMGLFKASGSGLNRDQLKQIGTAYFPYRYGVLSEEDRRSLLDGKGGEISARALSQVYGVMGLADAGLLKTDPFLLMPRFLTSLPVPASRLALDDGLLTVREDGKTWILVAGELKGEPYELDVQNKFTHALDDVILAQQKNVTDLTVLRTGALFFAKAGAEQAMHETSLIGVVSVIATVLILIAAFRSAYPLVMSLLVIAVGLMVALSFSLWFWGELHVCALLFGMSLIGVAVDYSLEYCCEIFARKNDKSIACLKRVLPAISLGAATTIIGYLTLLLAPFPGLRQIALFSVIGLLAAWLTVVLWLPYLDCLTMPRFSAALLARLTSILRVWEDVLFKRYRTTLIALLCVACCFGVFRFHVDDDVRKLQTLSPALVAQQEQIQKLTGATNTGQFFVIQAATDEQAIQMEEALADRLLPFVENGTLRGFQSLARYVPSLLRQDENRHLVVERLYRPLLAQHVERLHLSVLPPMPQEGSAGLTLDAKDGPLETLNLLSLLKPQSTGGGVVHVVTLDGVTDATLLAEISHGLDGVSFVNPVSDFTTLFAKYRVRAVLLLGASVALMFPFVAVRYGIRKAVGVMGPSVLAIILTPALCGLLGSPFTFFDAIALVLVLSMGMDYSIFFMETPPEKKPVTLYAVSLSALATIMSFGFLALSGVLAVHNFGLTMLIGVFLAFIFAPFARTIANAMPFRPMLAGLFVVFLVGCAGPMAKEDPTSRQMPAVVQIAPDLELRVPSFHELDRPVDVVQSVVATYGDQIIAFEGRINATPDHFTMVCSDPMGRKVLTIKWTDAGIFYDVAPWLPPKLRPENILADLIVLYWPSQVVERALSSSSSAKVISNATTRSVYVGDKEILTITYSLPASNNIWAGKADYTNLAWNYGLHIQSLALAP